MQATTRQQAFWLILLFAFWAFFGLTGRDAWKAEEAVALGHLLDWQASGGLPLGVPAPFHTALSALTAWLSKGWLDVQDGARLASGVITLAALLFTALAARELFGPGFATAAALALMGSFGLLLRAHALLPETALLMGYALLLYGLALARRLPRQGGGLMALALAVLLLSRGLPDLAAGGLIVALSRLSLEWRGRASTRALYWLGGALAALLGLWLLALAVQGDGAIGAWLAQASTASAPLRSPLFVLNLLSWFAWPVWPLAIWAVWHEHRRIGREHTLHPLLIATAVLLLLALWPAYSREGGALPLLAPLSLLAAHGVATLKRGGAQGFYWFGAITFFFFALAFWVYFAAIQWGWPTGIAQHMQRLAPNYRPGAVDDLAIGLAVLATAAWLLAIPLFPRAKARPVLVWATGMVLAWCLLMTLFRPWAEAGWGYRPLIEDMARHLPEGACLNAEVDPAMQAMLRLHLDARYQAGEACAFVLSKDKAALGEPSQAAPAADVQSDADATDAETGEATAEPQSAEAKPAPTWLWSGHRPREKRQVYYLHAR